MPDCTIRTRFIWNQRRVDWAFSKPWTLIKFMFQVVYVTVTNVEIFCELTRVQWEMKNEILK